MGAPRLDDIQLQELTDFFQTCSIFDGADPTAFVYAAENSELLHFKQGDPIILENEVNDSVHFVVQGAVEIAAYLPEEKRVQRLILLKEGSQFGEFSVLTRSPRSGSAYAYSDCVVVRLPGPAFLAMVEAYPTVAINLLGNLARFSQSALSKDEFIPLYVDGSRVLTEQVLQILPQAMWKKFNVAPVSLKAGVLSVAVRDPHNTAFFMHFQTAFPKLEVSVSIVGEREFNSLLENVTLAPAQATSRATASEIDYVGCLKDSKLFGHLSTSVIEALLPRLKVVSVKAGDPVLQVGQVIENSFVVLRGSIQMSRPVRGSNAVAPALLLREGESFGDEQVLLDVVSPCSCRAMEETDLLVIPKDVLNELLDEAGFVFAFIRSLAQRLQKFGHVSGIHYVPTESKFDFNQVATVFSMTVIDEEKIVPLRLEDGELTIGFVNPESSSTLIRIDRYLADYRVRIAGITDDQFRNYRMALKAIVEAAKPPTATTVSEKVDVVKWVNSVLADGYRSGASDIHFEPTLTGFTVRFRIDGVLRESGRKLPSELIPQAVSRVKILSSMDIAITHVPQDGHLQTEAENLKVQARVSTLPVKQGEKIVLRLIREKNSVVPLEMIAPDRRIVRVLKSVTERRQGLFLVTGPTGSGKTSTLYSLLKLINQVGVNVISIEDPVEMELRGVNQVEINSKRGLEFADALKSVLRQDPDVVMVGEIRDAESARVVFDAAMTGCLVLSTLHSGTSFDAVHRLKDLGISPDQIAEGLVGVITQRLVRKVCKHCERDHALTDTEREMFALVPHLEVPQTLKRGDGCTSCGQTGYSGRLPVFETWANQRVIGDGIRACHSTAELEAAARANGFETLFEFGLRLIQSGSTTPEEIRRVLSGTGSLF